MMSGIEHYVKQLLFSVTFLITKISFLDKVEKILKRRENNENNS